MVEHFIGVSVTLPLVYDQFQSLGSKLVTGNQCLVYFAPSGNIDHLILIAMQHEQRSGWYFFVEGQRAGRSQYGIERMARIASAVELKEAQPIRAGHGECRHG